MKWELFAHLPEPGIYWYNLEDSERILVEVITISEPAQTDRHGFSHEAFSYRTVRLFMGLRMWPDQIIKFPSYWAGPIIPPEPTW